MRKKIRRNFQSQILGAALKAHQTAYPSDPFGVMIIGEVTALGANCAGKLSPAQLRHSASVLLEAADDIEAGKPEGRVIEQITPFLVENKNREDL